ncbi:PopZ family protein [Methylobacterium sp. M6A4_1b]
MSAASPKASDMAQEPSMEEILASIRRIIADDQIAKAEVVAPQKSAPPPQNDDVLDLAEVAKPVRKPIPLDEPEIAFRKEPIEDGQIDFDAISFDDEPDFEPLQPPRPAPVEPPRPAPQPAVRAPDPEPTPTERLTSAVTDASVAQAFHMLSNTVMSSQARTLEELVQDMLRPMLKGWLDENLPGMVERLVRAEIERVARGR